MAGDEIEDYLQRTFDLDCVQMVLRQNTESPSRIYEGPGSIYQTSKGQLRFKIYDRGGRDLSALMRVFEPSAVKAGQIIPPNESFTLEATDRREEKWSDPFIILPRPNQGVGDFGPIVTGTLRG